VFQAGEVGVQRLLELLLNILEQVFLVVFDRESIVRL
jgi:hypothetical protein